MMGDFSGALDALKTELLNLGSWLYDTLRGAVSDALQAGAKQGIQDIKSGNLTSPAALGTIYAGSKVAGIGAGIGKAGLLVGGIAGRGITGIGSKLGSKALLGAGLVGAGAGKILGAAKVPFSIAGGLLGKVTGAAAKFPIAAKLGNVKLALQGITKPLTGFISKVGLGKVALGALTGPIGWVVTGISLLRTAVKAHRGDYDDLKDSGTSAFSGISDAIREAGRGLREIGSLLWQRDFSGAFDKLKDIGSELYSNLKESLSKISLRDIWDGIKNIGRDLWDSLIVGFEVTGGVISAITEKLQSFGTIIKDKLWEILQNTDWESLGRDTATWLIDALHTGWNALSEAWDIGTSIKDWFTEKIRSTSTEDIKSSFSVWFDAIKTAFSEFWTGFTETMTGGEGWTAFFENIFRHAYVRILKATYDFAKGLYDSVVLIINNIFLLWDGFAIDVYNVFTMMYNSALYVFVKLYSSISGIIDDIVSKINAMTGIDISWVVNNPFDAIKTAVDGLISSLRTLLGIDLSGLFAGVAGRAQGLVSAASSVTGMGAGGAPTAINVPGTSGLGVNDPIPNVKIYDEYGNFQTSTSALTRTDLDNLAMQGLGIKVPTGVGLGGEPTGYTKWGWGEAERVYGKTISVQPVTPQEYPISTEVPVNGGAIPVEGKTTLPVSPPSTGILPEVAEDERAKALMSDPYYSGTRYDLGEVNIGITGSLSDEFLGLNKELNEADGNTKRVTASAMHQNTTIDNFVTKIKLSDDVVGSFGKSVDNITSSVESAKYAMDVSPLTLFEGAKLSGSEWEQFGKNFLTPLDKDWATGAATRGELFDPFEQTAMGKGLLSIIQQQEDQLRDILPPKTPEEEKAAKTTTEELPKQTDALMDIPNSMDAMRNGLVASIGTFTGAQTATEAAIDSQTTATNETTEAVKTATQEAKDYDEKFFRSYIGPSSGYGAFLEEEAARGAIHPEAIQLGSYAAATENVYQLSDAVNNIPTENVDSLNGGIAETGNSAINSANEVDSLSNSINMLTSAPHNVYIDAITDPAYYAVAQLINYINSSSASVTVYTNQIARTSTPEFTGYDTSGAGFAYPLASGIDYVPYDNYPALLHTGERVLTSSENKSYSDRGNIVISPTYNINGSGLDSSDLEDVLRKHDEEMLRKVERLNVEWAKGN